MQDCKTLNAKVQVVAWLSTSTQLVSAFLELWMFVDVIMSLETPSFLVCVQTDHERASKKQVCAHKLNGLMRLDVQQKLARRWRLPEFENVS